jgi:hypothetical protein
MAAVFGPSQDGSSENADATQRAAGGFDFTSKVLSLVTFFAPAKKVTRLQAKAFDVALLDSRAKAKIKPFRAVARVHFFCWPKRNEPKKRALPDEAKRQPVSWPEFSDSPFHGSIRKRRPSMAAALRVYGSRGQFEMPR